jgi:hypothetical protein
MTIKNNFNLTEWSGNKYFILTTGSAAGGRNYLLPIMLLLASIFSFFAAFYVKKVSV